MHFFMAQSFQVAPEYVDEITFTTKVSSIEYRVSSIEPNSGIDKYRRNQVSNQHYPGLPLDFGRAWENGIVLRAN